MSASTVSIVATRRNGCKFTFPIAAIKTLIGTLACLDNNNRLVLATDAAQRRCVGLFAQEVDNREGAAGDLSADVEAGCFLLGNSVANAVTDAHVGRACFIEDNQTVASDPGANGVVAGIVAKVDPNGVWVHLGIGAAPVAPVSVVLTSTNGTAAAASANLAGLAAEAEKIGDDVRALHAALKAAGLIV